MPIDVRIPMHLFLGTLCASANFGVSAPWVLTELRFCVFWRVFGPTRLVSRISEKHLGRYDHFVLVDDVTTRHPLAREIQMFGFIVDL